jgi:phage baseplate assembly protein gpV
MKKMSSPVRKAALLALLAVVACESEVSAPRPIPAASQPSLAVVNGSGTWTTTTPMPTPRTAPGGVVLDGKVYAIGGLSASFVASDVVERYTPGTDSWDAVAPLPVPTQLMTTVSSNGHLFSFGGIQDGLPTLAPLYEYDPSNNTWTSRPTAPSGRYGSAAAVVEGDIYTFGGFNNIDYPDQTWVYRHADRTWAIGHQMPRTRFLGCAAQINGLIYLFGGFNAGGPVFPVDVYDPFADSWTAGGSVPFASLGCRASVLNGIVYIVGGGFGGGAYAWAYNPATAEFTQLAATPVPLTGVVAGGFVNGTYYVETATPGVGEGFAFTPLSIKNHPPIITIGDLGTVLEGTPVQFTGGYDPDGDDITFNWSFGDGTSTTADQPFHTYTNEGHFTARVTVTDSHGAFGQATVRVAVQNVAPVVTLPAVDTILAGETYNHGGSFTDPGTDTWTGSVLWTAGDDAHGLTLDDHSFTLSHRYNLPGTYDITVSVFDGRVYGVRHTKVVVIGIADAMRSLHAAADEAIAPISAPDTTLVFAMELTFRRANNRFSVLHDRLGTRESLNEFKGEVDQAVSVYGLDGGMATTLKARADRIIAAIHTIP